MENIHGLPWPPTGSRLARELDTHEALALLASVPMGRVVFTCNALPAIRPVTHIIDNGAIVFRSHARHAIVSHTATSGAVVAYQADELDTRRQLGWSVTVTGLAHIVQDPETIDRYQQRVPPWMGNAQARGDEFFISVYPTLITGTYLIDSTHTTTNGDGERTPSNPASEAPASS